MPVWMNWIDNPSPVAVTIISVALMLAVGFLMTRVTKLLKLPNVVCTPHIGANTIQTRNGMAERIVSIVKAVCNNQPVLKGNLINGESLRSKTSIL